MWSAVSIDATRVEEGAAASVIAGSPLWPQGQPGQLQYLWQEMKAALVAAKQDWEVWTNWYDRRLAGHVRDEEHELAYVRIEEALWDQSPAIVNAEIIRLAGAQMTPPEPLPARERPLAEINNREELEAWLRKQPREVSVAIAARAALRVLPIVWEVRGRGFKGDFFAGNVLPVFRATGVAWAAAKYLAQAMALRPFAAVAAHAATTAADAFAAHAAATRDARAAAAAAAAAAATHAFAAHADAATRAARAAARAADAAGGAAALSTTYWSAFSIWSAVSIDATRVEEGAAASAVAGLPLWPQGQPKQLQSLWMDLKAALLAEKQDWQVWTDWYDGRLGGHVWDQKREFAYVRIKEALWDQGPALVNAEIKQRIEEHKPPRRQKKGPKSSAIPEIPPQRPAALEPVWSNGKLVLPARSARTDGDKRANAAALKALRAELVELADDVEAEPSNFDKRAAAYFRRIAERISDRAPPQHELFRLAHAKEVLEGHASTVNDQWPDHLAPRFHALTLIFERTVRQFPKWREFVRNAQEDRLTPEQAAAVPALADAMILALREDEARSLVDPAVPSALETLQAPLEGEIERLEQALDPIELGKLLLAEDIVESVDNIMKRIAEAALTTKNFGSKYGRKWKEGFAKEALSSAEKDGGKAYVWMKRTLIGIMTETPALAILSQFGWLKPLLHFFGH